MLKEKPYLQKIELWRNKISEQLINEYPFTIPCLKTFESINFHADVTFIVGENGTGKSTLIEGIALALGFSPEGGTKNVSLETSKNTSVLDSYLKLTRSYARPKDHYFLRAESFYNVATYMDNLGYLKNYGGKSLHHQSHGEAFLSVLVNKLKGNGLYIFDEPEAALSPQRQLTTLARIHHLVTENSQFIIATHSPILMAYPNAKILSLDENGINEVKFEETEHFKVYDMFFKNYQELVGRIIHEVEK